MERVKNLEDVKVGDEFIINNRYNRELSRVWCVHVTPKQAMIGTRKYWKKGAEGIGGSDSWDSPPPLFRSTPEALEQIKIQEMRNKLATMRWHNEITDDQVRAVSAIVFPEV